MLTCHGGGFLEVSGEGGVSAQSSEPVPTKHTHMRFTTQSREFWANLTSDFHIKQDEMNMTSHFMSDLTKNSPDFHCNLGHPTCIKSIKN